jgi:hypothetical protein
LYISQKFINAESSSQKPPVRSSAYKIKNVIVLHVSCSMEDAKENKNENSENTLFL